MERQTSGLEVGEWLWIPSVTEAWQAGVIIAVGQGDGVDSLVVEVPNSTGAPRERITISLGSQHAGSAAAFHRWNKDLLSIGGVNTAQDLSKLALLHEPAVLQALQLRFAEGIVYTSSGPVLLAVNPYRQLPDLYDNTMLRSFMDLQLGETAMPHIYGTANDAYNAVWHKSASQTVLVSGESGSGKTETTKLVMRFIAFASAGGEGDAMSVMEKQVLESIPLLEALGNAKTLRNDNSSRFGKYIEMQLRVERGTQGPQLIGARTHTYLLEKVRVMGAREGERSFHIFYQVLAAASTASASSQTSPTQDAAADEDSFHSTSQPLLVNGISIHGLTQGPELGTVFRPRDFTYLNHSSCEVVANCDEVNEFNRTLAAMRAFNMADSDISHVLSSLMAVLHLGNLAFRAPSGNSEGSEIDVDVPGCPLHTVSSLLGISATGLQDALCRRKVQVTTPRSGPDGIQQTLKMAPHRTCAQALEGRNALARHLYGAIFNFVVMQVNIVLSVSSAPASRGKCSDSSLPFVGVLDIFGFEFFKNNSFEQLCVNFTNELLQQYFNEVIFKHEAALYIREQVPWDPQDFPDNSAIVELVAGVPSNPLAGVFPMLDEECNITGGTHMTWCSKLNSRYRHSELFKVVLIRRENFTIQHFAGPVEYTSDQFLEKNRDILSAEVLECMHCSKNTFIRDRFLEHGRLFGAQRDASTSGRVTRARAYSVSSEFRQQLKVLMQNIRATTPHFVRCIKPNPRSLPQEFDRPSVVEQLRYQGVLEAIRVSRAGYPLRLRHREAVFRYRPLMPRALCQRLDVELASQKFEASARRLFEFLQKGVLGMKAESVQVGDTLVFFKNDALILLDASLQQARSKAATRVQAGWRGAVVCRQYHRTRKAALILQAVTRGILARRFVVQFRRARAAITLQRVERGRRARCIFLERLGAMIKIQRRVKAWQARIFFCKAMKATVRLQRWHHSTVQRIRYRKCVRAAMQVQRCWRGMRGRIYAARFLHTQNKASLRIARHWRFWVLTRIRDRAASQTGFISGSPGCAHEKQCEHADGESSSCSSLLGSTGELLAAIECLRSLSDATSYEISSLRRSCSTADIQLQSLRSEEDRAHRQLHQDSEQASTAARAVAEVEVAQAAVQTYTAQDAEEQRHEVQHDQMQAQILHQGQHVQPGGQAASGAHGQLADQLPAQMQEGSPCPEQTSGSSFCVADPREAQFLITLPKGPCEPSITREAAVSATGPGEASITVQAATIAVDADPSTQLPERKLNDSICSEQTSSSSSSGAEFETRWPMDISPKFPCAPSVITQVADEPLDSQPCLSDSEFRIGLCFSPKFSGTSGDGSQVSQSLHAEPKTESCSTSSINHLLLSSNATSSHVHQGAHVYPEQSEQQTSTCEQETECLQACNAMEESSRVQDAWLEEDAENGDTSDDGANEADDTHNSNPPGCRSSSVATCEPREQSSRQTGEASRPAHPCGQVEKTPASPGGSDACTAATSSPDALEPELLLQGRLTGEPEDQDEEQPREISDCSSWRSPSLPLFSPSPSRGFSARLFCENNSQRGFSKFWTCIGHKRHADDLPRPHRWADKLAARARRRAPRRFKYQGLLTQATAIAGQVVADHTAHISSQALEVVPQVSGSWSWIVISSAEVQVQKLVHLILTYNFVASGARGTEALRGNFSVPMYTKSELQVMHPIRLHEHAVMLLQSVQRARALSEAPAADDMELIPWILRAQQLYTDEQQSARGLCNQESLSRLAAMCLGFLGGREEEGFWLLHCFAEEVLGFRSIKADADAALFVEMLAHEAPQLASALSVDVLEEAAASLVVQCWPCAFVNFLIDEPLIRLWEELLNRQSSACPRFPLFKWLLGLVRSAEPAIMQMLPIWPVREVVPQLCSHVRQIARTLPADWRPRLSLSDRQLLKLIAAAARRRPPARDDHAASWIYVQ